MEEQQIMWIPAVVTVWENEKGGSLLIVHRRLAKVVPPKSYVEVLVKTKDGTVVEITGKVEHVSLRRNTVRIHLPISVAKALGVGPTLVAVKNYDVPPLQK